MVYGLLRSPAGRAMRLAKTKGLTRLEMGMLKKRRMPNGKSLRQYSMPCSSFGPYRQRGMIDFIRQLFSKSDKLTITIKDEKYSFNDIRDFKIFLSSKVEIPASKLQDMLKRSDTELKSEFEQLQRLERTIMDKLAATIRDPSIVDKYLDDATLVRFSQDYDWRQIIYELSKRDTECSEYKLEAVTHYLRYLQSRVATAQNILLDRRKQRAASGETPFEEIESEDSTVFASTRSIDLSKYRKEQGELVELERLPRGQSVVIETKGLDELKLKLGSRHFVLKLNDDPTLISKKGEIYALRPGENLIGRSSRCNIVIDPSLVDISRQHLIVELLDDGDLIFTDMSSSGSFIPAGFLDL